MDKIFKSKDSDKRAGSTPKIVYKYEELKKTDELSIPKIDLEKLGIGVYEKDDNCMMTGLIDKNHANDYSNNNSSTDLPMINK